MRLIGFLLYCLAQRSMFLLHVVVVRSHRSQNIVNCTSPTLFLSFLPTIVFSTSLSFFMELLFPHAPLALEPEDQEKFQRGFSVLTHFV